jgi:phosphoglycolate phosphatase
LSDALPRYPLVVWDFDGTLADTFGLALTTFNELAGRWGLRPITDPESARRLTGREFLRQHGVSWLRLPRVVRAYHAAVRGQMAGVQLFAGVPELLRGLRGRGVRLGVLSSNTRENILTCLAAAGLAGEFEFVVGYSRLFGKARALRRVLRATGVAPGQCLYVGDEVRDLEAARRAGAAFAAVSWGFHAEDLLAGYGPTYLVRTPAELLPVIGV